MQRKHFEYKSVARRSGDVVKYVIVDPPNSTQISPRDYGMQGHALRRRLILDY